jgi:hypothetical protein
LGWVLIKEWFAIEKADVKRLWLRLRVEKAGLPQKQPALAHGMLGEKRLKRKWGVGLSSWWKPSRAGSINLSLSP